MEERKKFIIDFGYYTIILGGIYLFFHSFLPIILPFILGFFICAILKKPIEYFRKVTKFSQGISSFVVITVFYLIFILAVGFAILLLCYELSTLLAYLPEFYENRIKPVFLNRLFMLDEVLQRLNLEDISRLSQELGEFIFSISKDILSILGEMGKKIPSFFVAIMFTVISSYLVGGEYDKIEEKLSKFLNKQTVYKMYRIKKHTMDSIFSLVKAQITLITITFVMVLTGLLWMKIPYGFLISVVIGVADIIPFVGVGAIFVPWILIQSFLGNIKIAISLLILYMIISFLRSILEPRIMGAAVQIHPLISLGSILVGGALLGFWGFFLFPLGVIVVIKLVKDEEKEKGKR